MTGTLHIVLAMKSMTGNFVSNALKHGVAGLNIDGSRIETGESLNGGAYAKDPTPREAEDLWTRDRKQNTGCMKRGGGGDFVQPVGRWPSNVILDDSEGIAAGFPTTASGAGCFRRKRHESGSMAGSLGDPRGCEEVSYGDTGTAARFFKQVKAI